MKLTAGIGAWVGAVVIFKIVLAATALLLSALTLSAQEVTLKVHHFLPPKAKAIDLLLQIHQACPR